MDKIQNQIEALLKDQFSNAKIISLSLKDEVDDDGERYLKIQVVFEAEGDNLDAGVMSGMVRRVRESIGQEFVDAFPIISYISKKDAELAGAAA